GGCPQDIAFNAPGLLSLTVDSMTPNPTVAPKHINTGQNFANFGVFDWDLMYQGNLPAGSFTSVFDYTTKTSLTPDQLIAQICNTFSVGGSLPVNAAIHLHGGPNGLSYKLGNADVTPEAPSLVMLVFGLFPLFGWNIWQRRRRRVQ